jgi:hypothetical protein
MLLRIFASEKAAVTGGLSSRYQPTGSGTFQTSWERIQGGLDDSFRVRRRQHDLIYRWSAFDAQGSFADQYQSFKRRWLELTFPPLRSHQFESVPSPLAYCRR